MSRTCMITGQLWRLNFWRHLVKQVCWTSHPFCSYKQAIKQVQVRLGRNPYLGFLKKKVLRWVGKGTWLVLYVTRVVRTSVCQRKRIAGRLLHLYLKVNIIIPRQDRFHQLVDVTIRKQRRRFMNPKHFRSNVLCHGAFDLLTLAQSMMVPTVLISIDFNYLDHEPSCLLRSF